MTRAPLFFLSIFFVQPASAQNGPKIFAGFQQDYCATRDVFDPYARWADSRDKIESAKKICKGAATAEELQRKLTEFAAQCDKDDQRCKKASDYFLKKMSVYYEGGYSITCGACDQPSRIIGQRSFNAFKERHCGSDQKLGTFSEFNYDGTSPEVRSSCQKASSLDELRGRMNQLTDDCVKQLDEKRPTRLIRNEIPKNCPSALFATDQIEPFIKGTTSVNCPPCSQPTSTDVTR